jgi:hypothetical protein
MIQKKQEHHRTQSTWDDEIFSFHHNLWFPSWPSSTIILKKLQRKHNSNTFWTHCRLNYFFI